MDRRFFLKTSGIALASFGVAMNSPSFLARAVAQTKTTGRRKTLIVVFQRGAMDSLNSVIPYGEATYYQLRPNIAVARPKSDGQPNNPAAIDLDGFFALSPALASFKPIYDAGQLAIVHAVGSHDTTRSHFDAQDYMEAGTPGVKSTTDGWLNRYLQAKPDPKASPFRAVAMGPNLPRTLQGKAASIAMNNINEFAIRAGGGQASAVVQGGFEAMYEQTANQALRGTGHETFEAVKLLKRINPSQHQPAPDANYPRGRYGDSLKQIAQLIKSDIGLEVAFADIGGWDTHANEGAGQGQLANRLLEFSQGIAALHADLKDRRDDVVILTMTEFGRTAKENGNRGTDHGHASCMFVLGGNVNGGKVLGKWPGLQTSQLYEGRDLAITTDFRDVFAEVAMRHLGAHNLAPVFPDYQIKNSNFRGIIRS
ncbi:MAG TPA: DUF1501 domain-containing protein [Blastocatellia bacterium]|nr:DUF1501 domain-containing protein [Blastocatellia bacterium]